MSFLYIMMDLGWFLDAHEKGGITLACMVRLDHAYIIEEVFA
jgi:hypothetical protein